MTAVNAELQQLVETSNRIPCRIDLVRLCEEFQLDAREIDWRLFPSTVDFEVHCIDNVRNLFQSYIGEFSHNEKKFCLQIFVPVDVLLTGVDVQQSFLSMLAGMMRRREVNRQMLNKTESITMITYYCGFACVILRTAQFGDLKVFESSVEKCLDSVCGSMRAMADYTSLLDSLRQN